ncbi:MAG: hypothetical protein ACYDEB_01025 [Dehalococcoidia bacterium]
MPSTSRRLAAQIALGAAFATALAWKTARAQRRPAPHAALEPAGAAPAWQRPRHSATFSPPRTVPLFAGLLPDRLRPPATVLAVVLASFAVVGAVLAFAFARSGGSNAAPPAAVASAAAPTPGSFPTPTLADTLLDARRQLDLASVRDALTAYTVFFGAYPSTGGVLKTLCSLPTDTGCQLARYAAALPSSDGLFPYWYASDGQSFTLLARVQTPPEKDDCPGGLPSPLARAPVYCVRGTLTPR